MSGFAFFPPQFTLVNSSGRPYAGAVARFYEAGTNTPLTVYTTAALSTAHGSSVTADAAGVFPPTFVDPEAGDYKVSFFTSGGSLIRTIDSLPATYPLTSAQVGAALYPRTDAEIAASVTPTDYTYSPGDVRRYGATGDGSTDDTEALQAALDVSQSHPMFLPPAASYYKITTALTIPGTGAFVIGSGYKSIIRQATASTNGFTYSGSTIYNCTFRDVAVGVAGSITGATAFNLASVSNSAFYNCQVVADSTAQGFLTGVRCYTAVDASQASYINEFFGCRIRTAVSASARGYLFDAASACSSNSHHIFGGECRADSGKGVYVPQNGGGATGTSNQIVVNGVSFEGTTAQAVHIVGGSNVDQCCMVSGCRFEEVANGILFDTDSYGNVAFGNFYSSGLTNKVVDSGEFNAIMEPSATAGALFALERGSFRGGTPYTGSNAVFEGRTASEATVVFGGMVTGDDYLRIGIKDNGRMEWGSGAAAHDVALIRPGTGFVGFDAGTIALKDGMTAPSATAGYAKLFVDQSDGDLKVIFGDGTTKVIVADT